jgi:hypothetical protein
MSMTAQGYPLWAAWDDQWGPVVGWVAEGPHWRPVCVPLHAAEAPAEVIRWARLFATADEAELCALSRGAELSVIDQAGIAEQQAQTSSSEVTRR